MENLLVVKRKERKLSIANCADLVGISRQQYNNYEKLINTPRYIIMIKISKLLSIPLGTLAKIFEEGN